MQGTPVGPLQSADIFEKNFTKKIFEKNFFGIFKVENAISKFLKNFFEFCFKFLEQKKIFFGFLGKNFFLPQKFQKSPKPQGTTLGKKNFFRKKIF